MTNTRSIEILLEFVNHPDLSTRRRIEAAEAILSFESPADAVTRARDYLAQVFEDREQAIADRMDALQISRKFDSRKVTPQTVRLTHREEADRKEAWRKYEIMQLKHKIIRAIQTHPPPGWDAELQSPDYLPPPGTEWPPKIRLVGDKNKERGAD